MLKKQNTPPPGSTLAALFLRVRSCDLNLGFPGLLRAPSRTPKTLLRTSEASQMRSREGPRFRNSEIDRDSEIQRFNVFAQTPPFENRKAASPRATTTGSDEDAEQQQPEAAHFPENRSLLKGVGALGGAQQITLPH